MKIIAYLRVSTNQQELDNQRLALMDYAHKNGFNIDEFVQIKISSKRKEQIKQLDELVNSLEQGDTLIVSELSRLGRSLGQVINIVDRLVKDKIKFIAIKENISFEGKQTLQSKVMVTMFALFAEVERDLISERTKEGLAHAKAKGKILGRPKGALGKSRLDGKEEEIKMLLAKNIPKASVARFMDVSRTTLLSFIKSRKLKI